MSSKANYVHVFDEKRLSKLRQELTDLLFEKGHTITKPMIDDLAIYVYGKEDLAKLQITMTTTSQIKEL